MDINIKKLNERLWPFDRIHGRVHVFRDLSSLHTAGYHWDIGTTDEGSFHLMVCFDGQEVTFMESAEDSQGNMRFMVAKELGPLRFLLSFNLTWTGSIDLSATRIGWLQLLLAQMDSILSCQWLKWSHHCVVSTKWFYFISGSSSG
jgi:hypothetical protein